MYGLEVPDSLPPFRRLPGCYPQLSAVNDRGISFKCLLGVRSALTFDGDSCYDLNAFSVLATVDREFDGARALAHLTISKAAHKSSFQ